MPSNPFLCPSCGYDVSKPLDAGYTRAAQKLFKVFPPSVQNILKKISEEIRENIPTEADPYKMHRFLFTIQIAAPEVIKYSCDQYLKAGYQYQGKGFAYLGAIIKSRNTNNPKLVEFEKKRLGTVPKIKELK